MKKRNLLTFVAVGIFTILSIFGTTQAAPIFVDVNCTMKPGGAEEGAINKFKEVVEKESNGRMQVRKFMSGQLGGESEVYELMKIGQTHISLNGGLFRVFFAREYDAASIPFFFPTYESLKAFLEGPVGAKIRELSVAKGGLIDFGPQNRPPRQMTANRRIVEPKDLKGLKLRIPENPIWMDTWRELGTIPVAIPAPEIYMAMKTGQVEAHENTLVSPYSRKLWEVQKYIILTSHIHDPWHWGASKVWFDKLDARDQKIIREAVKEAIEVGERMEDEKEKFYANELKKNGMEFVTPNRAAFRQKAKPAIERAVNALAPGVAEEAAKFIK